MSAIYVFLQLLWHLVAIIVWVKAISKTLKGAFDMQSLKKHIPSPHPPCSTTKNVHSYTLQQNLDTIPSFSHTSIHPCTGFQAAFLFCASVQWLLFGENLAAVASLASMRGCIKGTASPACSSYQTIVFLLVKCCCWGVTSRRIGDLIYSSMTALWIYCPFWE